MARITLNNATVQPGGRRDLYACWRIPPQCSAEELWHAVACGINDSGQCNIMDRGSHEEGAEWHLPPFMREHRRSGLFPIHRNGEVKGIELLSGSRDLSGRSRRDLCGRSLRDLCGRSQLMLCLLWTLSLCGSSLPLRRACALLLDRVAPYHPSCGSCGQGHHRVHDEDFSLTS